MAVFITSRRNKKSQMSKIGPVRRGMPRITARLTPFQQFLSLLLIELTPKVARRRHDMRVARRRLKAELQTWLPHIHTFTFFRAQRAHISCDDHDDTRRR